GWIFSGSIAISLLSSDSADFPSFHRGNTLNDCGLGVRRRARRHSHPRSPSCREALMQLNQTRIGRARPTFVTVAMVLGSSFFVFLVFTQASSASPGAS